VTALTIAFVGGTVFDGRSDHPFRTDVGVAGDRIVALGVDEVAQQVTPRTRVVDLSGRLLLPGLIDAHVHPVQGGSERLGCDLSQGRTKAEYLALVKAFVDSHPETEWVVGGGWAQAAFPGGAPRAEDLDAVCPDRPVVISNRDHHSAWVNSRALQKAGIDAQTPDPPDGRIERAEDGTPTGTLHEGARMLALRVAPTQTRRKMYAALLEAQRYLHSFGITGWQDALIGDYGNHSSQFVEVYREATVNGDLTARVNGALWWGRDQGLEQLDSLIEIRAAFQQDLFRVSSVKIMQDGVPENRTAAVLEPYLQPGCGCGGGTGISFIEPGLLQRYVTELDRAGFQVHFHAIGERAVRESLDAVQAARARNRLPGPAHHIAHLQLVHPDDVPRFAPLRVAANIQPLWAAYDPQMVQLNLPILGEARARWQYPFASLDEAGTHLCAGSDWPVTSPDPWLGLHVAVNRQHPAGHPDRHPEVFLPWQRLSLGTALRAYTSGAAWINGRAHYTGQIRRGYAADLVVVDRDPFEAPPEEIHLTRTLETFAAGLSVFQHDRP
jgi:predicted amidohydrolase YtcJ